MAETKAAVTDTHALIFHAEGTPTRLGKMARAHFAACERREAILYVPAAVVWESALSASPSRPHYLKREGPDGGVYVRVGSTNRKADRELVEELRRFARGEAFDEQPMPGLDSEALAFRDASESFAHVRSVRADLETLRRARRALFNW